MSTGALHGGWARSLHRHLATLATEQNAEEDALSRKAAEEPERGATADAGVVARFLSRYPGPYWSISLGPLVTEARQATGRFAATGRRDPSINPDEPPLYVGTVAYMLVVERAGECLRPAGRSSSARAPFLRALELFTGLAEPEREALYAFRCAWLYPYAPVTGDAAPRSHRFYVSTDGSSPAVRVQDTPWDGDLRLDHDTLATVVDVMSFGTLAEEVYARLLTLSERGELEVALPGGVAELRRRCAYFYTDPA